MVVVMKVSHTTFLPSRDFRVPLLLQFNVHYFLEADHLQSGPVRNETVVMKC